MTRLAVFAVLFAAALWLALLPRLFRKPRRYLANVVDDTDWLSGFERAA